jgi:hypothetical protein
MCKKLLPYIIIYTKSNYQRTQVYDVFSPTGDTIPYQVIDEAYVTTYFTGWCHFHTGNITIVLSWKNARGIRGIKIRSLFVRPESNTYKILTTDIDQEKILTV